MSGTVNYADLHDQTDLWDFFLPYEKVIITNDFQFSLPRPLRERDWKGPEHGPYHFLDYLKVPNNAIPIPPVSSLEDLSRLINKLYWKLGQQAERQKTVTYVTGGSAEEDAKRLLNARDGMAIRIDNPQGISEVKMGGPTQEVGVMTDDAIKKYNYMAGNPDLLSGTAKPANTLGQDQLAVEGSSGIIPRWEYKSGGQDVPVNGCQTFGDLNRILSCGLIAIPGHNYQKC